MATATQPKRDRTGEYNRIREGRKAFTEIDRLAAEYGVSHSAVLTAARVQLDRTATNETR